MPKPPSPSSTAAAPRSSVVAEHLAPGAPGPAPMQRTPRSGYRRPDVIPADGVVVRYLFSQVDRCPADTCRSTLWAPNGTLGAIQYRYCLHCGTSWKAPAIGREVDRGGDGTVIEAI